ncbi:DUF2716 domain-containing protein [Streptomyces sp. NPDC089919]|uniref:DUF2716 domain-containing protein n=1 Tax=Streptomyces sp. NPDC089919 TaxID=3155188 RepID=UPI003412E1A1
MNEPVAALGEAEYHRVWDRFSAEFAFRPSVYATQWPGIEEPEASLTWSLAALDDDPGDKRLDRLVEVVRQALRDCVAPGDTLLALDWQHESFRFAPHLAGTPGRPRWPLSVYPDGDYYAYLTEDFRTGSFGHPWEGTLCLFGPPLLEAAAVRVEEILGPSVRRAGRPVSGR